MGVDLSRYDNRGFDTGAGALRRVAWYLVNALVLHSWLFPFSRLKVTLVRWFGGAVGRGVVIKPRVNIKYPWNVSIGDHSWIGEGAWLDSLGRIEIGASVCISQDAYLLTGNHDYKDPAFGLIVRPIRIEDGAWVGARAVVCPGVRIGSEAVVAVGSVLSADALPGMIYRGNPAVAVRERVLSRAPDE